jgi:hypothetical protein
MNSDICSCGETLKVYDAAGCENMKIRLFFIPASPRSLHGL